MRLLAIGLVVLSVAGCGSSPTAPSTSSPSSSKASSTTATSSATGPAALAITAFRASVVGDMAAGRMYYLPFTVSETSGRAGATFTHFEYRFAGPDAALMVAVIASPAGYRVEASSAYPSGNVYATDASRQSLTSVTLVIEYRDDTGATGTLTATTAI